MLYNIIVTDYNDGCHMPEQYIYATVDCNENEISTIVEKVRSCLNPKYGPSVDVCAEHITIHDIDEILPKYISCSCSIHHEKSTRKASLYSIPITHYHDPIINMYNEHEDEEYRWGNIIIAIDREKYDIMTKPEILKMFEPLIPEGYRI